MAEGGAQCGDLAAEGTCHLRNHFCDIGGSTFLWLVALFFWACLSQFVAQQAESGRCFILSKLDTQFCLDHDPSLMRLGHHDLGPDHWIPLA